MTSLPLISHHLFVAAVENHDRALARPARAPFSRVAATRSARPVTFEVLADARSLPARATRPLRAALVASGT